MSDQFNANAIRSRLVVRIFSGKLVENRWRGDLVEEIVSSALAEDGWTLCSADWTSWDLIHDGSGLKIQVKQAARRQTWGISPSTNRYSIKSAKGYYAGSVWNELERPSRVAEIYIFAHHPRVDDAADHWDAQQWQFFVVAESDLPAAAQSISINDVTKLATPCSIEALASTVAELTARTAPNGHLQRTKKLAPELGEIDEAAGGSL